MEGRRANGLWIGAGAMACLGGTASQLMQLSLWSASAYLSLLALACAFAVMAWRVRPAWLWVLLALAVGSFGAAGWRATERVDQRLSTALEGADLELTGVISSLPRRGANGERFEFSVERARLGDKVVAVPRRVSLGWYANADSLALAQPDLRPGQRWQLWARLRLPHGSQNPHGFDVELWWFERGIGATGYVRQGASTPARRLAIDVAHPVERLRHRLRDAIERQVPDARQAGVLAALVVGDQGAIDRSDWEIFRTTGIAHLVSISGLHVTMFAWLAALGVGWGWRRSAYLMHRVATPHAARWGGLILAVAYAVLAGWGVPAQRTVWMIGLIALLQSMGMRWPMPLILLVIAAVVAVLDPWALLAPGFWLSFVAVGLLIVAAPVVHAHLPTWPQRLKQAITTGLRTQAVATVGLAPLTMLFFQQMSVVGFVANLIAIPFVTLFITPLALLGSVWPFLWSAAAVGLQGLMAVLEALATVRWAVWTTAAAPLWVATAGLLGGALLVLSLPLRVRLLGVPLLVPLLWPAVPRPLPGAVEVVAVDVGQGTAVLVRTQHHLLVYDTGPQYSIDADAGDRVLLPLLRARGEHQVDLLMLSHQDSDHVGGAASLLAGLPVRVVSSSLAAGHPLRARLPVHQACVAGTRWTWDGVQFDVLHPDGERLLHPPPKANGLSCVLRVQAASGRSILLTGDIEAAQEAALVTQNPAALRSDVLLVPHHGSKTSSSDAFLDAVQPSVAVVQAGYRSRYGHPAPEVLQRYEARGIPVQRSDRCGAWTWSGDGPGHCERQQKRRYWHHWAQ